MEGEPGPKRQRIPNVEEIASHFNCPVCACLLWSPKVLPCGHTLCEGCVVRVKEASINARCPECNAPMGTPTTNIVLLRTIEQIYGADAIAAAKKQWEEDYPTTEQRIQRMVKADPDVTWYFGLKDWHNWNWYLMQIADMLRKGRAPLRNTTQVPQYSYTELARRVPGQPASVQRIGTATVPDASMRMLIRTSVSGRTPVVCAVFPEGIAVSVWPGIDQKHATQGPPPLPETEPLI